MRALELLAGVVFAVLLLAIGVLCILVLLLQEGPSAVRKAWS